MKKTIALLTGNYDGYLKFLIESTEKSISINKDSLTDVDKQAILQLKEEVQAERFEWKLIQKVSDSISTYSGLELVLIDCAAFTASALDEVKKIVKQTYSDTCISFEIRAQPLEKKDGSRILFYISGTSSFSTLAALITRKHEDSSIVIEATGQESDKLFIPGINDESIDLIIKRTPGFNNAEIDFCTRASEAGTPGPFSIQKLEIVSDGPEPVEVVENNLNAPVEKLVEEKVADGLYEFYFEKNENKPAKKESLLQKLLSPFKNEPESKNQKQDSGAKTTVPKPTSSSVIDPDAVRRMKEARQDIDREKVQKGIVD